LAAVECSSVEDDHQAGAPSNRLDEIERLLVERGHDLWSGRIRFAVGRSGVAVGFPRKPMIHVSWWVLSSLAVLSVARRVRRRAGREERRR
jgi:hypothetical protein